MKRVIFIGILCAWIGAGCGPQQESAAPEKTPAGEPAPAAAASTPAPEAPKLTPPPIFTQTQRAVITSSVPASVAATNEYFPAQTVPDEVRANIVARFPFDTNECSEQTSELAIAPVFKRNSPGYKDGRLVAINGSRLVKGKFGNGILLEESHANLLSQNQADANSSAPGEFRPLKDTFLTLTTNKPWRGKWALKAATPGVGGEEGVAVEAKMEKALYDGKQIAPAHYVASVYLRGSNSLMLSLKEPGAGMESEPVVVNPRPSEWKRFACTYTANFPAKTIGHGHEADWKKFLPDEPALGLTLVFACATLDKQKTTFCADGFQIEQRAHPFPSQGAGSPPLSWMPGETACAQDEFSFSLKDPGLAAWKKNGAVSFWFKPDWDVRDSTQELMLYLGPEVMRLQHMNAMIRFQPSGVDFTPYDWKENWHHIAVTWNEQGRRVLYVDGYDYVNPQEESMPLPDATDLLVLSHPGSGNTPNGIVDDLILFNAELNRNQIKAIASYEPPPPPKVESAEND
jgi:hypothetical protein